MVRKLSLAMALVLGVSPLTSFAVGLGDIQLKSALNQYLDAEINLLSVDKDEISDIKVTLASPEAFRRSGIERPFILSKLRFQADETKDGKTIIRVSSRDPIREPFLNFLIEVNWPKGKLLREYTVLLDPPVTLDRRPAPVQAAPMQKKRSQQAATSRSSTAPAARSAVAPSDVAWAGSPSNSTDEYGPTQRNDTLWGIAKQVRTEGASMQQMMIALQRANPQAFIKDNINNLKVGQVLRVPRADEVLELNKRDAANAYREQLQEWQADAKPTGMAAEEPQSASESMETGQPDESAPSPEAELKIASARPSGKGEAGPSEGDDQGVLLEQLKQDLLVSEESKEAALQEAESVRSRVNDLESQLEDLQRLLTLKSEQLAKLQEGVGTAAEEAVTPEVIAETVQEGTDGSPVMAEAEEAAATADEPAIAENADSEKDSIIKDLSIDQGTETSAAAESPVMEEEAKAEAATPVAVTEPAPAPAVVEPEPEAKPVTPAPPPKEDNLLDMIAGDTTLLGVAVAGVVVLLALLWVAISRRRSNSADFQESILISTMDENDSEQVMGEIAQEPASHPTEETSFLSDFSPSDIDALQDETGEVDPLAEADVYIAYGRYQQAEELIRQAIDKFPERPELKHKLFEILYATKDKDAFVALAESTSAEGLDKKDPDAWNKVITMGGQLAAGHALFAGAAGASADFDDDELASLEDELGLDNELGLDEVSTTVDLIDPDKTEELDVFGGLDLEESSEFAQLDDLDALSMDDDLDSGTDENGGNLDEALDLPADETADFEDSLSLDADTDLSLTSTDDAQVDEDTSEFDMTLSHLDTDDLLEEESAFSIEDPLESAELEDLKLDADSEAELLGDAVIDFSDTAPLEGTDSQAFNSLDLGQADETPLELDDSFSLDDLDEEDGTEYKIGGSDDDLTDEINTKLDLARAYVDMEDAEGARNILEEVLKEGNDGQQQEARSLLDKLS